jgi:hypothetical protein
MNRVHHRTSRFVVSNHFGLWYCVSITTTQPQDEYEGRECKQTSVDEPGFINIAENPLNDGSHNRDQASAAKRNKRLPN